MAENDPQRQLQQVQLNVNGTARSAVVEPRRTLADTLRHDLGLTGTHLGCEHGICGACTVLVDGEPVRSCLLFAVQVQGCDVRTVEGMAADGEPHALQEAFSRHHALQCGFCTPGFLMLAAALVDDEPYLTREHIREAVAANLCRCTGYQGIIDAIAEVAGADQGGDPSAGRAQERRGS